MLGILERLNKILFYFGDSGMEFVVVMREKFGID